MLADLAAESGRLHRPLEAGYTVDEQVQGLVREIQHWPYGALNLRRQLLDIPRQEAHNAEYYPSADDMPAPRLSVLQRLIDIELRHLPQSREALQQGRPHLTAPVFEALEKQGIRLGAPDIRLAVSQVREAFRARNDHMLSVWHL